MLLITNNIDVPELGKYDVLFSSPHSLKLSVLLLLPICLTLTLQLGCLIRAISSHPSAETLCAAVKLFKNMATHTRGIKHVMMMFYLAFRALYDQKFRIQSGIYFLCKDTVYILLFTVFVWSVSNLPYNTPTVRHNATTQLTYSYCLSLPAAL